MQVSQNTSVSPVANLPMLEVEYRGGGAFPAIRVLLLANDMMPSGCVASSLTDADCTVTRAESVDRAIALAKIEDFDVVVVDFRPDLLGYQAVCQLRMAHIDLPLLFVSARSSVDAFNRAYAVGADDVAVLPLDQDDLKARMASLTARARASQRSQTMQVGRLEIDLTERYARVDGRPLSLYSDEYAAFEVLVSRNGAPVGKNTILAHAYDDADVSSHGNAGTLMNRLRRKLAKAGAGDLIQTMGGLGYAIGNGGTGIHSQAA